MLTLKNINPIFPGQLASISRNSLLNTSINTIRKPPRRPPIISPFSLPNRFLSNGRMGESTTCTTGVSCAIAGAANNALASTSAESAALLRNGICVFFMNIPFFVSAPLPTCLPALVRRYRKP